MCSAVAPHFLFHMHHAPTSQMSCIRIYTLYNELAASTATAVDLRILDNGLFCTIQMNVFVCCMVTTGQNHQSILCHSLICS